MNKSTLFCLLFCFAAFLSGAEESVPSSIKAVTLYPSEALITREAVFKAGKGIDKIQLDIEAFYVDGDSVSAAVFGDGQTMGVQLKEKYLTEMPQAAVKELEKKLEDLKESRKAAAHTGEVLSKKEEFLNGVVNFANVQVPVEMKTSFPKPEDLAGTMDFLGINFTQVYKERDLVEIQLRDMDKEIERVENELGAVRGPADRAKYMIEILFDSKKEQEIRIEASYLVSYAGWEPLYRADVPAGLGALNLTMFSSARQTTGEDWKKIKLSLSNVQPLQGGSLPDPGKWDIYLLPKEPQPAPEVWMMRTRKAMVASEMADAGVSADREESAPPAAKSDLAGYASATRSETAMSFEYLLPEPLDIPSREESSVLPVFTKSVKGEYFHFCAPQVNSQVFMVCRAESDREILGGMLNIYFGGKYVGKVYLSEKKPGEFFDIPLGADREVNVKREKVKDKLDETFLGKIERLTVMRSLSFRITVENMKDKPALLRLVDAIPVSATDKVVVKDLVFSVQPDEKNYLGKEGVMLWKIPLGPKETKTVTVDLNVTYPKDETVAGL
ncbi:MAG: DUF4139 domain-containing protein [Candidatus Omnitrophica bacterium]|nr:DUF4139 domain-containing protein [Candidatus Omnitrophota bacterium]